MHGGEVRFLTRGPFILTRQYLMAKQLSGSAKDIFTRCIETGRLRQLVPATTVLPGGLLVEQSLAAPIPTYSVLTVFPAYGTVVTMRLCQSLDIRIGKARHAKVSRVRVRSGCNHRCCGGAAARQQAPVHCAPPVSAVEAALRSAGPMPCSQLLCEGLSRQQADRRLLWAAPCQL